MFFFFLISNRNECAICLLPIPGTQVTTLDNCNHSFCCQCINEWICEKDSTCPCCRAEFSYRELLVGFNFGINCGLLTPVYEMVINFQKMSTEEKKTFCEQFQKTAAQLEIPNLIEYEFMLMSTFKEIVMEMNIDNLETIIAFNTKTDLKNDFLGYIKTRTYDEFIKNSKKKEEIFIIVRNFLYY